MPLLAQHLLKSHTEAIKRVPQIVSGGKNEVQRRTKASSVRAMRQALEPLRLAKSHVSGRSDIK